MSYAKRIIEKLGGTRPTARLLGASPNTVHHWKKTGVIPARRQAQVMRAACRSGVNLGPSDFFDISETSLPPVAGVSHDDADGVRVSDHLGDCYGMGDDAPIRALSPVAASPAAE